MKKKNCEEIIPRCKTLNNILQKKKTTGVPTGRGYRKRGTGKWIVYYVYDQYLIYVCAGYTNNKNRFMKIN